VIDVNCATRPTLCTCNPLIRDNLDAITLVAERMPFWEYNPSVVQNLVLTDGTFEFDFSKPECLFALLPNHIGPASWMPRQTRCPAVCTTLIYRLVQLKINRSVFSEVCDIRTVRSG
jgi:hypothetical protein